MSGMTYFEEKVAEALSETKVQTPIPGQDAEDAGARQQWWADVVAIAAKLEGERSKFDRAEFIERAGGLP